MTIENRVNEFKKQLRLAGYSFNSIQTYGSCVALFLSNFKSNKPSKSEIEDWLLSFKSEVYRKNLLCAIKKFNKILLNNSLDVEYIPYPRPSHKLPEILSPNEVQMIIDAANNSKHKSIIALLYSCGLRVGEIIELKMKDIDRSRMIINVRQGKNKKDRQVPLDENVLKLLEKYYSEWKPINYLYNGQHPVERYPQYSAHSIQQFLKAYAKKAGIKKNVHPHQFRHSCFAEMFNSGVDASLIQSVAGHSKQSTTLRYIHLSNVHISKIKSPITSIKL